jgi:LTXXQ motif family protein
MTRRSIALPTIVLALGLAAAAPATLAQNAAAPGPGMMPMMHGMMAQHGAMGMPFEHVEGRLAFLKTELKITDAQMPQWEKFAQSVRTVAQSVKGMMPPMMSGGAHPTSAPALLDGYEKMLTVRLDAVRTIKAAFDPLYAAFADEQKKVADELLTSPMGLM